MLIALLAWLASLSVVVMGLVRFARLRRPAGVAIFAILAAQLHVRPAFIIFGLDDLYPYGHFEPDPWWAMATASFAGLVWLVFVIVGYEALKLPARALAPLLPQAPARPDRRLVALAGVILTSISVGITALLIHQFGSLAQFTYSVKVGKELTGSYGFMQLTVLAALVCAYGLFLTVGQGPRGCRPSVVATTGFLVLIAANLAANYAWGNRYNIALTVFVIALGWHYYVRPFRVREILIGGIAFAALLQGLKYVRMALLGEAINEQLDFGESFWLSLSLSLHFGQFDAFVLALKDAGTLFDFRHGQDFWNGLISWVPRAILPDRESYHIGAWFRQVYEPETINGWPITVLGSWYVNFGVIGLGLGAVLSGMLAAAVDYAYRGVSLQAWHALVGPGLAFFLFDGGINTGFPQALITIALPLGLLALALRVMPHRSQGKRDPLSEGSRFPTAPSR